MDFIVRNSRAAAHTVAKLMTATDDMTADIGTVLSGREAVEHGLIDSVGGLGDALDALRDMIINGGQRS